MTKDEALKLKKRLEVEVCTRGYDSLSPKKKEAYDKLRKFFGQVPAQQARSEIHLHFTRASRLL